MNANNVWINQIPCATAITIKPTKTKRTNFIFQISRTLNDLVFSQSNEEHKFCCKLFIIASAFMYKKIDVFYIFMVVVSLT